jgi:cobalt-zinc-cadmium efflux system protein
MAQRTLEVPLPRTVTCSDCAGALHKRLAQTPGVHLVTFDNSNRKAFVEIDEDAFPEAAMAILLGDALTGGTRGQSLARFHERGHRTPPRASPRAAIEETTEDDVAGRARRNRTRLLMVAVAGTLIAAAEVAGGLLANSLVLLADAAHYLTDIAAVLLAYFAIGWGLKAATGAKTFGYQRAEVVAALVQALALWAVSIYFIWAAYQRIRQPPEVEGAIVIVVGAASMVANAGLAWILHQGSGHNINMRAAYLHILSDVLGSMAALAAGLAIYFWELHVADPVLTLVVTALILVFAWRLTKQSMHILLEGTPEDLDPKAVEASILDVDGVQGVHDLHVWTLTSGVDSLSVHVVLAEEPSDDAISHRIHDLIRDRYRIHHITVQVEAPDCPCDTMQHQWQPT